MNIVFMGGRQVGFIGLLALLSVEYGVEVVVCNGRDTGALRELANRFGIPVAETIKDPLVAEVLKGEGLLVSVHGSEIVPASLLGYWGGINIHPFPYKGADPIGKLLVSGGTTVVLTAHRITDEVDGGDVLVEREIDITGLETRVEVYNKLYPYYAMVLLEAIEVNESFLAETEMSNQCCENEIEEIESKRLE